MNSLANCIIKLVYAFYFVFIFFRFTNVDCCTFSLFRTIIILNLSQCFFTQVLHKSKYKNSFPLRLSFAVRSYFTKILNNTMSNAYITEIIQEENKSIFDCKALLKLCKNCLHI